MLFKIYRCEFNNSGEIGRLIIVTPRVVALNTALGVVILSLVHTTLEF